MPPGSKVEMTIIGSRGFSLVELMVVVAIIGILSALAIPRFRVFQGKARQAEAKINLGHLYNLEEAFYAENDRYVTMGSPQGQGTCSNNILGFQPNPCDSRYIYNTSTQGDTNTTEFTATATTGDVNGVMPSCPDNPDVWRIDQDKCLCSLGDTVRACDNGGNCATVCPSI